MKNVDIKRLESAAKHYRQIESLLGAAYDSIDNQPKEWFFESGITTLQLVKDMLHEAVSSRRYIEGKIRAFKDLQQIS